MSQRTVTSIPFMQIIRFSDYNELEYSPAPLPDGYGFKVGALLEAGYGFTSEMLSDGRVHVRVANTHNTTLSEEWFGANAAQEPDAEKLFDVFRSLIDKGIEAATKAGRMSVLASASTNGLEWE